MRQICGILDNDAYPQMVWGLYVPEVSERGQDQDPRRTPEERQAVLETAREKSETVLLALTDLMGEGPYLAGTAAPTLADFHALPMLHYFSLSPTGQTLLAGFPDFDAWLARMVRRPSWQAVNAP